MTIFASIFLKIIPIYLTLLLGFFARKFFNVTATSFNYIISYFIIPIVLFDVSLHITLEAKYFAIPLFVFFVSTFISLFFYYIGRKFWNDGRERLIASISGSSNIYIGLFIVLTLFNNNIVNIYLLISAGLIFYDITIGLYYIVGNLSTPRQFLFSKLNLASVLAITAGLVMNYYNFKLEFLSSSFFPQIKSTLVILGVIVVGLNLCCNEGKLSFNKTFTATLLFSKLIIFPSIILLFIIIDTHYLHLYSAEIYKVLLLLSILPSSTNTIIVSNFCHLYSKEVATITWINIIISSIYISFVIQFL